MPLALPSDVGTLTLLEDFITADEENSLLQALNRSLPDGRVHRKSLTRNAIQRWGSSVPYSDNLIDKQIPAHFDFLLDRLVAQNLVLLRPDSITLNQYLKNQAILAHIDRPDGGSIITVLSLMTPATMVFRRQDRAFTVDLPARSLVQMRDAIRYDWTHEINPVTDTRYSLVFRCSLDTQTV